LRPDGRIQVLNSGFKATLEGKYSRVKAVAWRPDASRPGALKVYSWAMAGNDTRKFPWFLSRMPTISAERWATMRDIAEKQGYDLSKLSAVPRQER
jgi:apolipoprotein D and lipocalin family protein